MYYNNVYVTKNSLKKLEGEILKVINKSSDIILYHPNKLSFALPMD